MFLLRDVWHVHRLQTCVSISFGCITFISQNWNVLLRNIVYGQPINLYFVEPVTLITRFEHIKFILSNFKYFAVFIFLRFYGISKKENTQLFQRLHKRKLPIPIWMKMCFKRKSSLCLFVTKRFTDVDEIFGSVYPSFIYGDQ